MHKLTSDYFFLSVVFLMTMLIAISLYASSSTAVSTQDPEPTHGE